MYRKVDMHVHVKVTGQVCANAKICVTVAVTVHVNVAAKVGAIVIVKLTVNVHVYTRDSSSVQLNTPQCTTHTPKLAYAGTQW